MMEKEEKRTTASIYFRGNEDVATYERIKDDATSMDLSFSEYAKTILSDPFWPLKRPKLFLRFAWHGLWGPYGKLGTMVKVLGGVPDRDRIKEQGQKMTCDELLTGLRTYKDMRRHLDLYEEVWSELYRDKMKQRHGVDIDEIRL